MGLRQDRGVTGIDITVAIVLITIFIGIISTLTLKIQNKKVEINRKQEALVYATQIIEQIKKDGFDSLPSAEETATTNVVSSMSGYISGTSYYKEVSVYDYTQLKEENADKISDILKKVVVKVSYLSEGEEEAVELSILLTKEN